MDYRFSQNVAPFYHIASHCQYLNRSMEQLGMLIRFGPPLDNGEIKEVLDHGRPDYIGIYIPQDEGVTLEEAWIKWRQKYSILEKQIPLTER